MWKASSTLLINPWAKEEIARGINKHFKMKENEHTTYKNPRDAVKAVP